MKKPLSVSVFATTALLMSGCVDSGPQSYTTGPELEDGPLDQYLGAVYSAQELTADKWHAQQLAIEELVSQCMKEQGFDYLPYIQGAFFDGTAEAPGPPYGSLEYAEQYGFALVEDVPSPEPTISGSAEDPNAEYFDALSASEKDAYSVALHGDPATWSSIEFEDGSIGVDPDWDQSGCSGWAQHTYSLNSPQGFDEDPELQQLTEGIEGLHAKLMGDPRTDTVNQEWSVCMEEVGNHDLDSPEGLRLSLANEYIALGEEHATSGAADWRKAANQFRDREITLAVDSWTCSDQMNYAERINEIKADLEQKFIEENKDQLDRAILKYGQG